MFKRISLLLLVTICAFTPALAKDPPKVKLKTISVAKAFESPSEYAGKVGLKGTVVELDSQDSAFVILTPNPPGSCQSECCAPKRLTVRVPKANFKGKLPKVDDQIVVVGELKPLTVGFDFKPSEVRSGDKVILSLAK